MSARLSLRFTLTRRSGVEGDGWTGGASAGSAQGGQAEFCAGARVAGENAGDSALEDAGH
jgi:hypothetical protein